MENGRKLRAMVDRKLVESMGLFGFRIGIRVRAADEPEHRWHLPCGAEAAEILARRRGPRVLHPIGRKIAAKRLGDAVAIYLDDGPAKEDKGSTIVDLARRRPAIVREGPIGRDAIEKAIGARLARA